MFLKKYSKLFIVIGLVAALITLKLVMPSEWFSIGSLKANSGFLQHWVNQHYFYSVLCFIFACALMVYSTLPFIVFLAVAGGFLFGAVPGYIYSNIGGTLGASFSFLTFRYLVSEAMRIKYKNKLAWLSKQFESKGVFYLVFLNVITITPFFLVNFLSALSKISLWNFVWATAVGMTPSLLLYSFAGKQLHNINNFSDIFSLQMILILAFLGLICLIPIFWKQDSESKN